MKVVIFGNSASGKSTLARELAASENLIHFDLDTIAWLPQNPPARTPIEKSKQEIDLFLESNDNWVIEGCYSDLIEIVISASTEVIFLNLPVDVCISNAKKRPWEPHKYDSKEIQDKNLDMLIDWIANYEKRTDEFCSGPYGKFCNAQPTPKHCEQGASRREWQALSKGRNAVHSVWELALREPLCEHDPALHFLPRERPLPAKCVLTRARIVALSITEISARPTRSSHEALFNGYNGRKTMHMELPQTRSRS